VLFCNTYVVKIFINELDHSDLPDDPSRCHQTKSPYLIALSAVVSFLVPTFVLVFVYARIYWDNRKRQRKIAGATKVRSIQ
jgi:hypothetical protein